MSKRNRIGIVVVLVCLVFDWLVIIHEKAKRGRDEITVCLPANESLK